MKILTFGIATDIIGKTEFAFEGQSEISVGGLRTWLKEQYPELGKLTSLAFAVNERYANDDHMLTEKDVIALIPPVSGG